MRRGHKKLVINSVGWPSGETRAPQASRYVPHGTAFAGTKRPCASLGNRNHSCDGEGTHMSSEAQSPLVSQSGLLPKGLTHSLACYFSPSSPAHLRFLGHWQREQEWGSWWPVVSWGEGVGSRALPGAQEPAWPAWARGTFRPGSLCCGCVATRPHATKFALAAGGPTKGQPALLKETTWELPEALPSSSSICLPESPGRPGRGQSTTPPG